MEERTPTTPTMRKREEPRLIQFKTGDKLEGILVMFERARVGGKLGMKYTVERSGGERVSFWGTAKINAFIHVPGDKGHQVSIECIGEDVTVQREGKCMKVFDIYVSDEVMDPNALYITDDDIPF
jgi:hypothetical protein